MSSKITFLTPTHKGDLERFCLQRESLEVCGIEIPHIAVVHDEDVEAFNDIPHQRNLTILSTKEVLPPEIEARRQAKTQYPRTNLLRWLKPKPLSGWWTQQIVKIASPSFCNSEGIVCLDSDAFFIRHVDERDFYTDGLLHLYEDSDFTVETVEWLARSMRFLDIPIYGPPSQYIHVPVVLRRQTLLDLQAAIEHKHNRPWFDAMLENGITEYMTYGAYARHINHLKDLIAVKPVICHECWTKEEAESIHQNGIISVTDNAAKIVHINSALKIPVSTCRHLAEQAWKMLINQ